MLLERRNTCPETIAGLSSLQVVAKLFSFLPFLLYCTNRRRLGRASRIPGLIRIRNVSAGRVKWWIEERKL